MDFGDVVEIVTRCGCVLVLARTHSTHGLDGPIIRCAFSSFRRNARLAMHVLDIPNVTRECRSDPLRCCLRHRPADYVKTEVEFRAVVLENRAFEHVLHGVRVETHVQHRTTIITLCFAMRGTHCGTDHDTQPITV